MKLDDVSTCPRCDLDLEPDLRHDHARPQICLVEHGVLMTTHDAERLFDAERVARMREVLAGSARGSVECPVCDGAMRAVHVPATAGPDRAMQVEVDGCVQCGAFWFDAGEPERLGAPPPPERRWGHSGQPDVDGADRAILDIVLRAVRLAF